MIFSLVAAAVASCSVKDDQSSDAEGDTTPSSCLTLSFCIIFYFLMVLIDWDGFEDDFVVALDAGDFESVGLGSVGQLLVVLAEGVAEAVDKDLGSVGDEGLAADEETRHEIDTRGLDDLRRQVGKADLCGVAVGVVAKGVELGDGRGVGGREGCDF